MERQDAVSRYRSAAAILPSRLRSAALSIAETRQARAEEIRLRVGQPMSILLPEGELSTGALVEPDDLETLCDIAAEFSRYAASETLKEGYLTVKGGYRVGLCGAAVMKDGNNTNLKYFSSAAVRIGRERKGISKDLAPRLFRNGRFESALLLSPPGGGKTTLLRDLIRQLSSGADGYGPLRVALIDERGEIAASVRGQAQMDVGPHTDILDACPKALGVPILLRAMNPQVIAMDELTTAEDLQAASMAAGCGVGLLATVHASNVGELYEKPLYRELLSRRIFRFATRIERDADGERRYEVESLYGDADAGPDAQTRENIAPDSGTRQEADGGASESDAAPDTQS